MLATETQTEVKMTAPQAALRSGTEWWRGLTFWLLGGATLLLYDTQITQPYSLTRYYAEPLLDLTKITELGLGGMTYSNGLSVIGCWLAAFVIYIVAIFLAPHRRQAGVTVPVAILFLPAFFCVSLAHAYPITAADVFDYMMHARITTVYAANTFALPPNSFPDDLFLQYTAWKDITSAYGPAWEMIAALASKIGGNSLWHNIMAFKGLAITFYLINALLILLIVWRKYPQMVWRSMVLYLWNPLVLFEVAVNAHNDAPMITGVLVAFLVLDMSKEWWARPVASYWLAMSLLVKFLAAPLLPLFWLDGLRDRAQSWGRRLQILAASVGVFALALVLWYFPFWVGPSTISALNRSDLFTSSVPNAVRMLLIKPGGLPGDDAASIARSLALAIFALIGLFQAWQLWSGKTTLARACFEVLFFYLMFCGLWFQPWYLYWLLPLAAIIPSVGVQVRTVAFTITAFANYVIFYMLLFWVFFPNGTGFDGANWANIYLIYPIPLLLTIGFFFYERRKRPALPVRTVRAKAVETDLQSA